MAMTTRVTKERDMLPKGIGQLGQMGNMLKQAMEMKGRIEELKDRLAEETVESSAAGGMVTMIFSGKFEVLEVTIDPSVISAEDPEMLQTLVQACINDGIQKVQQLMKDRMAEVTGGINIPGITD
jgi:DNA-binding YbaB/EbfC family protein